MSSSDLAISVRGLSKAYTIAHNVERHSTLAEQLLWRLRHPLRRGERETFYALRDVSFDIRRGDVVGVIGRNGAGKSTLLKILSRITEPTAGEIRLHGRVGSLLEVGTGFHPELTGRENIFLNGAILGMRRREIERQFDAIVDFSGVEKFLDTPVKRYSSGMYVRLAFAVAAHLNPEILIVDEVLAVGDAEFQRKCLGKMKDVASGGRTVLVVSHNMGVVRTLCRTGLVLRNGGVAHLGDAESAVEAYLSGVNEAGHVSLADRTDRRGGGTARLRAAVARGRHGAVSVGEPFRLTFGVAGWGPGAACEFTIYDQQGQPVMAFSTKQTAPEDAVDPDCSGDCEIEWETEQCLLLPGTYRVNVALLSGEHLEDHVEGALQFAVEPGAVAGRAHYSASRYGGVTLPHRWRLTQEPSLAFSSARA